MADNIHVRVIRLPEVVSRVGLKKTQIYQLMRQRKFPQAVKMSERATGWLEHEIDSYIAERVAISRPQPGKRGGQCGGPRPSVQ
jgi:prophage regulatory protein